MFDCRRNPKIYSRCLGPRRRQEGLDGIWLWRAYACDVAARAGQSARVGCERRDAEKNWRGGGSGDRKVHAPASLIMTAQLSVTVIPFWPNGPPWFPSRLPTESPPNPVGRDSPACRWPVRVGPAFETCPSRPGPLLTTPWIAKPGGTLKSLGPLGACRPDGPQGRHDPGTSL
jgi:hypothetical protein